MRSGRLEGSEEAVAAQVLSLLMHKEGIDLNTYDLFINLHCDVYRCKDIYKGRGGES